MPQSLHFSNKDMFKLFLPIIIEQFLEHSVGLVGSLMAAHVSEDAVSSVSLVEFVMALFLSVFGAIATGGAIVAGQYLGARDDKNAHKSANELMWLAFWLSLGIMFALYACKNLLLDLLFGDVSASVRSGADEYLMVMAAGVPALGIYAAGAALFRTMGNSKLPMYVMLGANFINLAMTGVAVYWLNFGILGLAVPMLLTRVLAAGVIVFMLIKAQHVLHLDATFRRKFDPVLVRKILSIGLPYSFENGMFYLGRIIVLGIVAMFGTASIAANAVGGTLSVFQILAGMSIGMGLGVIVSRCVGAGEFALAKFYTIKILKIVYVVNFITCVAIVLAAEWILSFYEFSQEATQMSFSIVWWHAVVAILIWPLAYTFPVAFRAAGDAKFSMVVNICCMFVCRIVLAYVFAVWLGFGMIGTWFAMFFDWAIKAILFTIRFYKDSWLKFRIV